MGVSKTITETWYENGAHTITVNGLLTYTKYDTGDEVCFDEAGKVWNISTHDGLNYTYHYPDWFNLTFQIHKNDKQI